MRKILVWTVLIVMTLFLTKYANELSQDVRPKGATFSLFKQKVSSCGSGEVVLIGPDGPTHLEIDDSWPPCSEFDEATYYDFWLARGGRTVFISYEKTPWWRKAV